MKFKMQVAVHIRLFIIEARSKTYRTPIIFTKVFKELEKNYTGKKSVGNMKKSSDAFYLHLDKLIP